MQSWCTHMCRSVLFPTKKARAQNPTTTTTSITTLPVSQGNKSGIYQEACWEWRRGEGRRGAGGGRRRENERTKRPTQKTTQSTKTYSNKLLGGGYYRGNPCCGRPVYGWVCKEVDNVATVWWIQIMEHMLRQLYLPLACVKEWCLVYLHTNYCLNSMWQLMQWHKHMFACRFSCRVLLQCCTHEKVFPASNLFRNQIMQST